LEVAFTKYVPEAKPEISMVVVFTETSLSNNSTPVIEYTETPSSVLKGDSIVTTAFAGFGYTTSDGIWF
jgi:hypothetical protein